MNILKKSWKFYKKWWYLLGLLLFLYFPIMFVVIFSFSDGRGALDFGNVTLDNYSDLFTNVAFGQAMSTTIYVSVFSTFISIIFGVAGAFALTKISRWINLSMRGISTIPIVTPDLVIGLSLFIVFTAINIPLGTFTLIISHVSFSAPYVMIVMYPKIRYMNHDLINASYDLGASKTRTFFSVILPQMYGSIFSASVIAFVMSFDDFVISFFTSGTKNNVSTYLFSLKRPSYIVNAFATLFLLGLTIIVFSSSFMKLRKERKGHEKHKHLN